MQLTASYASSSGLLTLTYLARSNGPLPRPFLLSYLVFDFIFLLFFRFWAVR